VRWNAHIKGFHLILVPLKSEIYYWYPISLGPYLCQEHVQRSQMFAQSILRPKLSLETQYKRDRKKISRASKPAQAAPTGAPAARPCHLGGPPHSSRAKRPSDRHRRWACPAHSALQTPPHSYQQPPAGCNPLRLRPTQAADAVLGVPAHRKCLLPPYEDVGARGGSGAAAGARGL